MSEMGIAIQIMQIVGYIVVATIFIIMIKADVKIIRVEIDGIKSNQDILNNAFSKLTEILTKVAVQDIRIAAIEEDVRELKHGRGFININGEYNKEGKK